MSLPRIGVFDSGVGGLTVLRALAERMPAHYIYFGDTARLPYGTKSAETVARYAIGATRFLESQHIDLLVIACNTASALALPKIKEAATVPVIGVVEPGAAAASQFSQSRRAIVIATEATVASHAYRDALQRYEVEAFEKACPLFVPLVEEGWTEHPVTEQIARIYLDEALAGSDGADVLVLACTHYPLIAPLLRRTAPAQLAIVDSAASTAAVVKKMVDEWGGSRPTHSQDRGKDGAPAVDHRSFQFFVTDSVEKFKKLATRFLGRQVDRVEHVDLGG